MRHVVFIVGMHRSGSSALARTLSLCGGALPVDVLAENFGNPTGYWEPEVAMRMNEEFLARHGSSWDDAEPTLQVRPMPSAERIGFIERLAAFLRSGFTPDGPMILKEPRVSGLLPYWLEAATLAGMRSDVIHVFRNPVDVAASLCARDEVAADRAHVLWLKYNLFAERDGRGLPRAFVSYEELLGDWERETVRCISEIGLEAELRVGVTERIAVDDFLRAELRHHASPALGRADPNGGAIHETYHLLLAAAHGSPQHDGFNTARRDYISSRAAVLTSGPLGLAPLR
jgi:hypothetical protein